MRVTRHRLVPEAPSRRNLSSGQGVAAQAECSSDLFLVEWPIFTTEVGQGESDAPYPVQPTTGQVSLIESVTKQRAGFFRKWRVLL
jgi:hypothetical protein